MEVGWSTVERVIREGLSEEVSFTLSHIEERRALDLFFAPTVFSFQSYINGIIKHVVFCVGFFYLS